MNRGVFLDRDGVLNKLIYRKNTGEYEPPHAVEEIDIFPWVIGSLRHLVELEFQIFLISNQPDYAKGKTSLESLQIVHRHIASIFVTNGITFQEYSYCYHHPKGIVSQYAIDCECRKPKPFFVLKALDKYRLDRENSWFIGDRDTDIECGRNAGIRTIMIDNQDSKPSRGNSIPDFSAANLEDAVRIIEKTVKDLDHAKY